MNVGKFGKLWGTMGNLKIENYKELLGTVAIWGNFGGTMGNLGNFGGTFNLGYFDGGTSWRNVGEPIGANGIALPLRN